MIRISRMLLTTALLAQSMTNICMHTSLINDIEEKSEVINNIKTIALLPKTHQTITAQNVHMSKNGAYALHYYEVHSKTNPCDRDSWIGVYNLANGTEITTISDQTAVPDLLANKNKTPFSAQGTYFVAGHRWPSNNLVVHKTDDSSIVHKKPLGDFGYDEFAENETAWTLGNHADGTMVVYSLPQATFTVISCTNHDGILAFSADAKRIYTLSGYYDYTTEDKKVKPYPAIQGYNKFITLSDDGECRLAAENKEDNLPLAVITYKGTVYPITQMPLARTCETSYYLKTLNDYLLETRKYGNTATSDKYTETENVLYNISTGQPVACCYGINPKCSPKNSHLLTTISKNTLALWHIASQSIQHKISMLDGNEIIGSELTNDNNIIVATPKQIEVWEL